MALRLLEPLPGAVSSPGWHMEEPIAPSREVRSAAAPWVLPSSLGMSPVRAGRSGERPTHHPAGSPADDAVVQKEGTQAWAEVRFRPQLLHEPPHPDRAASLLLRDSAQRDPDGSGWGGVPRGAQVRAAPHQRRFLPTMFEPPGYTGQRSCRERLPPLRGAPMCVFHESRLPRRVPPVFARRRSRSPPHVLPGERWLRLERQLRLGGEPPSARHLRSVLPLPRSAAIAGVVLHQDLGCPRAALPVARSVPLRSLKPPHLPGRAVRPLAPVLRRGGVAARGTPGVRRRNPGISRREDWPRSTKRRRPREFPRWELRRVVRNCGYPYDFPVVRGNYDLRAPLERAVGKAVVMHWGSCNKQRLPGGWRGVNGSGMTL